MPVRVGTESAPYSVAVMPAGKATAGSATQNSGCRCRNARICSWIFFRLDGAGRVNQPPAGLEQPGRCIQNGRLGGQ